MLLLFKTSDLLPNQHLIKFISTSYSQRKVKKNVIIEK